MPEDESPRGTFSLGIDIGTTYSAAAIVRIVPPSTSRVAEVCALGTIAAQIPTVVLHREDSEVLIGEAAERRSASEPTRTAREFKRRLGDPVPIIVGGTPYGAEALMAEVLAAIVAQVTQREGQRPRTFDAAIVRDTANGFELLGTPEGMERLGGIDFDQAVLSHVDAVLGGLISGADSSDALVRAGQARLRDECRSAKETLSTDTDATISVSIPGVQTEVRLTRDELEQMVRPRVAETVKALQRTIASAGLSPDDIDRVLLVGGSSRMPIVAQVLRESIGRPVSVDANPKLAIAIGAAFSGAPAASERVEADAPSAAKPGPRGSLWRYLPSAHSQPDDRDALDDDALFGAAAHFHEQLFAIAHQGGRRGCDVVVDRADLHAEHGVDQRALALLELADHANDRRRSPDPRRRHDQAVAEVVAAEVGSNRHHLVDRRDNIGRSQPRLRAVVRQRCLGHEYLSRSAAEIRFVSDHQADCIINDRERVGGRLVRRNVHHHRSRHRVERCRNSVVHLRCARCPDVDLVLGLRAPPRCGHVGALDFHPLEVVVIAGHHRRILR